MRLLQSQLGVFLESMEHPDTVKYNLPTVIPLPEWVDVARLKRAIYGIIASRPSFLTCFSVEYDGKVSQWTDYSMQIIITEHECKDDEVMTYAAETFIRPFDLLSGEPLVRYEIIKTEVQYYLIMDYHHCIMDGYSLERCFCATDIAEAYRQAGISDKDVLLPMPEYGMCEAAEDEASLFGTPVYLKAKEHYFKKFKGKAFLSLSTKPAGSIGKLGRYSTFISCDEVNRWCEQTGLLNSALFQAAFCLVMSSLSFNDELTYVSAFHGRVDKKLKMSYGMFVKTIPVQTQVLPEIRVTDFINGFKTDVIEAIRNMAYPFTHFCRDLDMIPGIAFNFLAAPGMEEALVLDGKKCPGIQVTLRHTDKDLGVNIYLRGDQYEIRTESSLSMNDEALLHIVSDCILFTVRELMLNTEACLADIKIISEEEEHKLIELGRGRDLTADDTKTIIDKFKTSVKNWPDAEAVVAQNGKLSYKELDQASDSLAKALLETNANQFVAVSLPRVKEQLVSMLAIFKSGRAYLPVDINYPEKRKHLILSDSGADTIIGWNNSTGELSIKHYGTEKVSSRNWHFDPLEHCDSVNLAKPEGYAYMIYTSGSTGKPKGVPQKHSALNAMLSWLASSVDFTQGCKTLSILNFSFDASLNDLLAPMTVGGSVHIFNVEHSHDLAYILDYCSQNDICGFSISTQAGKLILGQKTRLPFKFIVLGGEKLHFKNLPSTILETTGIRIINAYGPTEFSVCASYHEISDKDERDIPIGRPVPGTCAFVCDQHGHLVPFGMPGELYLAGKQLSPGYWNSPVQTKNRFVPCTFCKDANSMTYKTGDLVKWNKDGELVYLRRIDNQMKLRGFRIEPAEIESVAKLSGKIDEVAAVLTSDQNITLFYTGDCDKDSLAALMREMLASYMLPSHYVQLESMPLNQNGKIDRGALMTISDRRVQEQVEPESVLEEVICSMLQDDLNIEKIGVTESLKRLGMSSIDAMNLSFKLEKMNVNVTMGNIIDADNVKNIVDTIWQRSGQKGRWTKAYDDKKKVVVLSCGIISEKLILPNLRKWEALYNIYFLPPVFNAWPDYDSMSYTDILYRFEEELSRDLPKSCQVCCFLGFSYGGELSWHLANWWEKQSGQKAVVLMGDTIINSYVREHTTPPPCDNKYFNFFVYLQEKIFTRLEPIPFDDYCGPTVLISATKDAVPHDENEKDWTRLHPELNVIHIADSHNGLYEHPENFDKYLMLLNLMSAGINI